MLEGKGRENVWTDWVKGRRKGDDSFAMVVVTLWLQAWGLQAFGVGYTAHPLPLVAHCVPCLPEVKFSGRDDL